MKTPREVLFHRHQAADTKLDQIREVVAQIQPARTTRPESLPLRALLTLWRELILPARRTWAGLAMVWGVLLILQIATRDSTAVAARKSPPITPEMLMVLRQQQYLLSDLAARSEPRAVIRPKPAPPQPQSYRRESLLTA